MVHCTTKRLLFLFFNFLFWCLGLGLVGFVAWTLATIPNASQFLSGTYIFTIFSLSLGAVITVIGFIGCIAAICERFCLLKTYVGFMVTLLFLEIALAVYIYAEHSQISTIIIKSWDGINEHTQHKIQSELKCCGIQNYTEYGTNLEQFPDSCFFPDISGAIVKVMNNLYTANCVDQMQAWLDDHLPIWVSVLGGIALIEFLSGISSCVFLHRVQRKSKIKPNANVDDLGSVCMDMEMEEMEAGPSKEKDPTDTENDENNEKENNSGLIIVCSASSSNVKDNVTSDTIDYLSESDVDRLSQRSQDEVENGESPNDKSKSPTLLVIGSVNKSDKLKSNETDDIVEKGRQKQEVDELRQTSQEEKEKQNENATEKSSEKAESNASVLLVAGVTKNNVTEDKIKEKDIQDQTEIEVENTTKTEQEIQNTPKSEDPAGNTSSDTVIVVASAKAIQTAEKSVEDDTNQQQATEKEHLIQTPVIEKDERTQELEEEKQRDSNNSEALTSPTLMVVGVVSSDINNAESQPRFDQNADDVNKDEVIELTETEKAKPVDDTENTTTSMLVIGSYATEQKETESVGYQCSEDESTKIGQQTDTGMERQEVEEQRITESEEAALTETLYSSLIVMDSATENDKDVKETAAEDESDIREPQEGEHSPINKNENGNKTNAANVELGDNDSDNEFEDARDHFVQDA